MRDVASTLIHSFPKNKIPQKVIAAKKAVMSAQAPFAVRGESLLSSQSRDGMRQPREVTFAPVEYHIYEEGSILGQGTIMDRHGYVFSGSMAPHVISQFFPNYNAYPRIRSVFTKIFANPDHRKVKTACSLKCYFGGTTLLLPVSSPSVSHFLFEAQRHLLNTLPKVERVIITTSFQPYFVDLVHLALGYEVEILFRGPDVYKEKWVMENVLVPTYSFYLHPEMRPVVDRMVEECNSGTKHEGLIYISRRDTGNSRMMLNEDYIERTLEGMGFAILELFKMPEREIIEIFSNARVIVGSLGAGLYNTIYSRPETSVIALCAPNYIRSFLYQCAAFKGFRHSYCIGPDFLSYEESQVGGNNDFVVSENDVVEIVAEALESNSPLSKESY